MNRRSVAAGLATIASVACLAAYAGAHTKLEKSEPAANAALSAAPTSIQMWFNEAPDLKMTKVELTGASGKVELGPAHSMGKNNVMAAIVGKLSDGKYTVSWQTAGDDGHLQKGSFAFTLKH